MWAPGLRKSVFRMLRQVVSGRWSCLDVAKVVEYPQMTVSNAAVQTEQKITPQAASEESPSAATFDGERGGTPSGMRRVRHRTKGRAAMPTLNEAEAALATAQDAKETTRLAVRDPRDPRRGTPCEGRKRWPGECRRHHPSRHRCG